jgi:MFS transporter, putative metabolite:H+ symporter
MLERLEKQTKLTKNQWKIIATANVGDMLDFFDFFLIGYVLAFVLKDWNLTFGQSATILMSAGLGAVPGAFFWGWLGDRIGRRKVFMLTALNVALATGILWFTPGPDNWLPGWVFLSFFRFFVGFGNAGLIAVDIPLVQEFVPASKRGWVSGLTTVLLPAGNILAAAAGAWLAPVIGWRGLFLVGLAPALLVVMIRYWIPESPHWLMRVGRHEEARRSLAWALNCNPHQIELATDKAEDQATHWRELFRYPRSVAAVSLIALSQTGGAGLLMWITALFVLILGVTPAEASYLMIWVGLLGVVGRLAASWMSDALGRRASGVLIGLSSAFFMVMAGYYHDAYIGSVSAFFVLVMLQRLFGDASYAVIGPYLAEVWPNRLRASGMGLGYGIGNLGKVIGPVGLAFIVGSSNYVSPRVTLDSLVYAFLFLAYWYLQAAFAFLLLGIETRGRSIADIDAGFKRSARSPSRRRLSLMWR